MLKSKSCLFESVSECKSVSRIYTQKYFHHIKGANKSKFSLTIFFGTSLSWEDLEISRLNISSKVMLQNPNTGLFFNFPSIAKLPGQFWCFRIAFRVGLLTISTRDSRPEVFLKKVFFGNYAANLQENTIAEVWFW